MKKDKQLGYNIKRQMLKTVENQFASLTKTSRRFVFDMLFGLIKSGDCKITNIGRCLKESMDLKQTVKRLYLQLNSTDFTDKIDEVTIKSYPKPVDDNTVFALDFTDITKPYAKKMEHLSMVRDGDKGTIGKGYNAVVITATELGDENPSLLSNKLFSKSATPDLKSTDIALEELEKLYRNYENKGVYVQDRYFDNKRFYQYFSSHNLSFVTRAKTNRKLLRIDSNRKTQSEKVPILQLAKSCRTPHKAIVRRWKNGAYEPVKTVKIGSRRVFLPCINQSVFLVVVKGFGRKPMMLLTNIDHNPRNMFEVLRVFDIYKARWKCEEWIRYVKTEFNLEDIRTLNWVSINNLISFINLATSYIAQRIGYRPKLISTKEKLIAAGMPVFFKKAKMTLTMICYGLREVLSNIPAEFRKIRQETDNQLQLELPL